MLATKEAEIRSGGVIAPASKAQTINDKRTAEWLAEKIAAARLQTFSEMVTVTPALAALLLSKNDGNRHLSAITVDRIRRDIEGGRWEINGESIVLSIEGKLNDGQHRCQAVVDCGRPIRTIMVFGVSRESRMTVDQGSGRRVSDFLVMNGVTNATRIAAVASFIWMYKNRGMLSTTGRDRPTKSEALLVANHYRDIPDSLQFVNRSLVSKLAPVTCLAFCHWAIGQRSTITETNAFFEKLITGEKLERGDPILYTRQRLFNITGRDAFLSRVELIFRAWNAYRLKERVTRITIVGGKLPKLER